MFGIVLFIIGACVGALVTLAVTKKLQMPWYSWLLTALCVLFVGLAFEVLINSFAEYEPQAGLMSFGLFSVIGVILLAFVLRIKAVKVKKAGKAEITS